MIFKNYIREKRQELGLTLDQLGCRVGVAYSTLSDMELGKRQPWPKARRDLAEVLGVTEEELFPNDPIKEANWLLSLVQIKGMISPIIRNALGAMKGEDSDKQLTTFGDAIMKLNPALESLKSVSVIGISKCRGIQELTEIQELEKEALSHFIFFCELSIKQIRGIDGIGDSEVMAESLKALGCWIESARLVTEFIIKEWIGGK